MKSVSVTVQGVNDRGYIAHVRNESPNTTICLRNSPRAGSRKINLIDGPFLIVLRQDSFSPQIIDVGPPEKDKVFSLIVEKRDYYDQPTVKLIDVNDTVKCALYRRCAGGGISFVLAVGDTDDSVSVSSVRKHQLYGAMQAFEPVF
ncbi:hypothetical protein PIROE2DRAFT_56921 [Piromyces sp. E2]|nr:hypothetical protein PIROE2DRAFT_56921 [Piromyces sp. E2]|eukprot:OUM70242.1 hypothetical protein PIROE2DRAFT_56921 [Piromyces sp. E2]